MIQNRPISGEMVNPSLVLGGERRAGKRRKNSLRKWNSDRKIELKMGENPSQTNHITNFIDYDHMEAGAAHNTILTNSISPRA